MVETDGAYRTDDMALATVLAGQGHSYRLERLGSRTAVWVFEQVDEDLESLVATYTDYGVRVEPRTFVREFTRMRRELFAFMPKISSVAPLATEAT